MVTPQEWQDDLAVGYGATFNLAHDCGQMLHFRPQQPFRKAEGVYLVGGGTHPGSGLPVIYEGARISARLLVQGSRPGADGAAAGHAMRAPAVPATVTARADARRRRAKASVIIGPAAGVSGRARRGSAAGCAAARGHQVTLLDKNPWLGGKAAVLQLEAGGTGASASTWARPS